MDSQSNNKTCLLTIKNCRDYLFNALCLLKFGKLGEVEYSEDEPIRKLNKENTFNEVYINVLKRFNHIPSIKFKDETQHEYITIKLNNKTYNGSNKLKELKEQIQQQTNILDPLVEIIFQYMAEYKSTQWCVKYIYDNIKGKDQLIEWKHKITIADQYIIKKINQDELLNVVDEQIGLNNLKHGDTINIDDSIFIAGSMIDNSSVIWDAINKKFTFITNKIDISMNINQFHNVFYFKDTMLDSIFITFYFNIENYEIIKINQVKKVNKSISKAENIEIFDKTLNVYANISYDDDLLQYSQEITCFSIKKIGKDEQEVWHILIPLNADRLYLDDDYYLECRCARSRNVIIIDENKEGDQQLETDHCLFPTSLVCGIPCKSKVHQLREYESNNLFDKLKQCYKIMVPRSNRNK